MYALLAEVRRYEADEPVVADATSGSHNPRRMAIRATSSAAGAFG